VARILFERRGGFGEPASLTSAEMQAILAWLDQPELGPAGSAEYRPPIDVIETESAVEIVADVPGVALDELRVVFNNGAVIVAGRKRSTACQHQARFHLAERTFGRFAAAIRITASIDLGRAHAKLQDGELHITLPRIAERRRLEIAIPIERA
jgi:HSP20 family protein